MKKIINLIVLAIISASVSSCFSHYPIQKRYPCNNTTRQEKVAIIKKAFSVYKDGVVTDEGVSYGTRSFKYSDIYYVKVRAKGSLKGMRYWIMIKEFSGEISQVRVDDFELMEQTNNALMCLSNLQDTNGRPAGKAISKPLSTPTDKYSDLEKLKKLLDSGAITPDEYEKEKAKILNL